MTLALVLSFGQASVHGCPTPVGKTLLEKQLSENENLEKNQDGVDSDTDLPLTQMDDPATIRPRPILKVASGGTVCVDVSNMGRGT